MTNHTNPLLSEWETPFKLPPFEKIKPEHFEPAFEQAIADHNTEIQTIADNSETPCFTNTIEALEKSGETLKKVGAVFFNLSATDSNETLQSIERKVTPLLARHRSDIELNGTLFERIDALQNNNQNLDLSDEQLRVLDRYYKNFIRAGAMLPPEQKKRMAEINENLALLCTKFSQNLLKDESDFHLVLDSEKDLDGLPDFLRASAKNVAEELGYPGKYVITLSRSSIEPFLSFSKRRDLREQAFKAWINRGAGSKDTNNTSIISKIISLRLERARLLDFKNFAEFKLDDTMAKNSSAVAELLQSVWQPALHQAKLESSKLQDVIRSEGGNFDLEPWDWRYYSEKVRKTEFDIDEFEIKPYFQLEQIISAAFETAHRLFGLEFEECVGLELYHADVRAWEVRARDGTHVGLFLGDYFARPSKKSGAWMSSFRSQDKLDGNRRAIILNVMNFVKGGSDKPTLLSFDDARTLFHEFGHALHGLLSDVTYPSISGTNVVQDFVELPSQLYEHWLSQPEILKKFAVHYCTGKPLPGDLLDKILKSQNFNQGFTTVEYIASALVDLDLHRLEAVDNLDVIEFEKSSLDRIGMPREIVMRHRLPQFSHLFSGGSYAAGYYSYLWSETMDADAFKAFEECGDIFDENVAARLHDYIYSSGGKHDPAAAYTAFRGRMPVIDALLQKRGFKV